MKRNKVAAGAAAIRVAMRTLVVGALGMTLAHGAAAQSTELVQTKLAYAVPAGTLGDVLLATARVGAKVIVFDPVLTDGRTSKGVKGLLTRDQAMHAALDGTGLVATQRADGAIVIALDRAPNVVPVLPVVAATTTADAVKLPDIDVVGSRDARQPDDGFVAHSTGSVTRTDTPLSEVPQSVQVITKDLLQSQQTRTVLDAVAQISGVTVNDRKLQVRGFDAPIRFDGEARAVEDGLAINAGRRFPVALIESISVLKGADAITAGGATAPGGMLDVVTKKPQAEPVRQMVLEGGTLGHKRASLDLAGALSPSQAWTYRFIASDEQDARNDSGYRNPRSALLAPSLAYEHAGTRLVLGMELQKDHDPMSDALYRQLGRNGPQGPTYLTLPFSAADPGEDLRKEKVFITLEKTLFDSWTFKSTASFAKTRIRASYRFCEPLAVSSLQLDCFGYLTGSHDSTLNTANTLGTIWWIGNFKNSTLLGYTTRLSQRFHEGFNIFPLGIINYAPVQLPGLPEYKDSQTPGVVKTMTSSVFLQDQIKWGRWSLLANAGVSAVRTAGFRIASQVYTDQKGKNETKPTYSLGLAYQLSDSVTAYVNHKTSFETGTILNSPIVLSGQRQAADYISPPIDGVSSEAGLKFNLSDDRLVLTTSVFRVTKTNVLQRVGRDSDSGLDAYELLPATSSKGVELDVSGRVLPGWNVNGSLSYTDFSFAKPRTEGYEAALSQLPRVAASLWSSYEFQGETLQGWGYGVGVAYRSGYATEIGYRMPGQARVDASVFYKSRDWTLTLGVKNLFDRQLYQNFAIDNAYLEPGRRVTLTGVYNF